MKRWHIFFKPRFYIFGTFILLAIFTGCFYSTAYSSGDWISTVSLGEFLDLNPLTTQWVTIKGQLTAISLIDGKLAIFEPQKDTQNWVETQRIGPDDISFTTFQVKAFNNDGTVEIVAGTVNPGFIYIYKLNNGNWELFNYGKYVWSAITFIAIGNFGDGAENDILVQNQEGSLYLLKMTDNSLDLIWKSPTIWQPINSGYVLDIDHDSKDEIMVVYKTGGIGILKMESNAIVSVWENYLWGKVLTVTSGDWKQDQHPELIIGTSQKVIYFLGWTADGGYQFEDQWSQLNYTIEKLVFFNNNGLSQLLATDTAGKFHLFEYDVKNKAWVEDYVSLTGRIAQIINTDPKNVLLWGDNRKIITVQAYMTNEIKLVYQDAEFEIEPAAYIQDEHLYISPKALQAISAFNLTYNNNKTTYKITQGDQTIEISKKDLTIKINGDEVTMAKAPVLINEELFLPLESYQTLFRINLTFDVAKKAILATYTNQPNASNI